MARPRKIKEGASAPSIASHSSQAMSHYVPLSSVEFIPTGCQILDLALSGGIGKGRIYNIIGDSATGKTLLAIILAANHRQKYPKEFIDYIEAEQAFDEQFARSRGLPSENITFPKCITVEDFYNYLEEKVKANKPGLVILDSLDALTTESELERDISKGTYGDKAKLMSEVFRRINQQISAAGITVCIISQTRDKLGVMFGRKWTRAGGNALEFYSSQIIVLSHRNNLVKEISGVTYTLGTTSSVVVHKNKFGPKNRKVDMPVLFVSGIDDVKASLDWLKQVNRLEAFNDCGSVPEAFALLRQARGTPVFDELRTSLSYTINLVWNEIEAKIREASMFYGEDTTKEDSNAEKA